MLPVASTFDSLDVDPFAHIGDRDYVLHSSNRSLAPSYRNGLGGLKLDLTSFTADGTTHRTELRNAAGSIEVVVPPRVQVVVRARIGWGEFTVDDTQQASDIAVRPVRLLEDEGRDIDRTVTMSGEAGAGTIEIDATTGLGVIRVRRAPLGRPIDEPPRLTRPPAATAPPAPTVSTAPTIPPASTAPTSSTETR
jgi:hypothetical protein